MIIIPIEESTLPVVLAMNGGKPLELSEELEEHMCFVYHAPDNTEVVATSMVEGMFNAGGFTAVELPIIVQEVT